ncbi:hypothetical protein [Brachybacterium hainanense]|uniref:Uncharacterized protein n=1 Tax=Brachybacterium hainanense TaxID=1541174 RepID=A0ABV6RFY3_9MICO
MTGKRYLPEIWFMLHLFGDWGDYRLAHPGGLESIIADFEKHLSGFLARWDRFEDLWRDLLHGNVPNHTGPPQRRKFAALTALGIAHTCLEKEYFDEAMSYILSRGWQYRSMMGWDMLPEAMGPEAFAAISAPNS